MKTKHIRVFLILSIVIVGVISFALSAQNAEASTDLSDRFMVWLGLITWKDVVNESYRYRIFMGVIRQGAHFTIYAVGTLPVFLLIYTYKERIRTVLLLTLFSVGLYAVLDEIHQLFVSGRSFQLLDMATDILGAICTSLALAIVTYITNVIYHEHSNEKIGERKDI